MSPAADAPRGVTVLVTNYNGRGTLDRFLPRVVAAFADVPDHEILVVDDASTDDSVAWLRGAYPGVRVVVHPRNRGFPVTAHTGFTAARHPYVFLLSSDMVPRPGCLEAMFAALAPTDDVLCVGGPQVTPDGRFLTGRFAGAWRKGALRVRAHPDDPADLPGAPGDRSGAAPGEVYHQFQNAVGLYRRAVYLEVGGFCELFAPFYFEEVDLSYRAWKLGFRVLYRPDAIIEHFVEESSIAAAHGAKARKAHHRVHQYYCTWKNVSDPGWVAAHLAWLAARTLVSWTFGDWPFYRALAGGWRNRAALAARRADLLSRATRSDAEVMAAAHRTLWGPGSGGPGGTA